jgi:uncharacterized membrane protein YsdA (DUF1294 family)/cold shock CspA family protein
MKMTSEIGKISSWNDEKGFGFIMPNSGGKSVFVHINDYTKRHKRPMQGLPVIYSLSKDPKGRPCAINVYPEKGHKEVTKAHKQRVVSASISGVFLSILIGLVLINKLPFITFVLYIVVSILTFGLYAGDKSAAQQGKWRTSESTLHLFSLVGGWPGAVIAQSQLRHKSKKLSFRVVFWFTVVINCGILCWLLTPEGAQQIENLIRALRSIRFS